MPPSLPPPSTLPSLPTTTQTQTLDLLFEPSPPLQTLVLPLVRSTHFPDYPALIAAINAQLRALAESGNADETARLSEILCAHPRLGASKVESELSRGEQAGLQQGEGEELMRLNEEYEHKFPGLRYVVFVNGRSRPVIMANMKARIERGDIEGERREAIQAMCDIAADRAAKLPKE